MDREPDIDFARWRDSADWKEVILPAIAAEEEIVKGYLLSAEPTETAEIVEIKGRLYELDRMKNAPARYFERMERQQAREEEDSDEKATSDPRRRDSGTVSGTVRRLLNYGARRA